MKSCRACVKILFSVVMVVALLGVLVSGGCDQEVTDQNDQEGTEQNDQEGTEQKTLTIGVPTALSFSMGVEMLNEIELQAEIDNQAGGLEVGGEKYLVEVISYDTGGTQDGEVSAVNRLIYEDDIQYILSLAMFGPAWLSVADENDVLCINAVTIAEQALGPEYTMIFDGSCIPTASVLTLWMAETFPDLMGNMVGVYPDNQTGHTTAASTEAGWASAGMTPHSEFYPSTEIDHSALATTVVNMNPTLFWAGGAGLSSDALVYKAVWGAGYEGELLITNPEIITILEEMLPAEAFQKMLVGCSPLSFDPPLNQAAADFKDAWIAKYGTWECPTLYFTGCYALWRAALQAAGTTDPVEVAEVISQGLDFTSPLGVSRTIDLPHLGNDRCVAAISEQLMGNFSEDGELQLLYTLSLDDAIELFYEIYSTTTE